MQITVGYSGRKLEALCEFENILIGQIKNSLESIDLPKNAKEATTSLLRGQLDETLAADGWLSGLMIDNQISLEYPTANYTLDIYMDQITNPCGHKHRFFSEFCFDNRQAIGTNLLKFQVSAANSRFHGYSPLGFLICADGFSIKNYGWDGGVASYQEYDHAIRIPYKNILNEPPILISIRS